MKKTTVTIIVIFVIFLLLLTAAVVSPYIKAEYLTARYGDQFEGLEKQTNMLDGATYFKVLSYSEAQAKVFYVSDSGDVITFAKNQEGQWTIQNWYSRREPNSYALRREFFASFAKSRLARCASCFNSL